MSKCCFNDEVHHFVLCLCLIYYLSSFTPCQCSTIEKATTLMQDELAQLGSDINQHTSNDGDLTRSEIKTLQKRHEELEKKLQEKEALEEKRHEELLLSIRQKQQPGSIPADVTADASSDVSAFEESANGSRRFLTFDEPPKIDRRKSRSSIQPPTPVTRPSKDPMKQTPVKVSLYPSEIPKVEEHKKLMTQGYTNKMQARANNPLGERSRPTTRSTSRRSSRLL